MPLKIAIVPVTPLQQNCSLLWDDETMVGAVCDPGGDIGRLNDAIHEAGFKLEKVLLTHGHLDHAGAAGELSLIHISYNVRSKDDVASVLSEAVAAGARLVKPAEDVFWGGHSGYFADPDGHFWEVAWNPHSPLEADGSLRVS